MAKYVIYKRNSGCPEEYVTGENTFSVDIKDAKKFNVKWWIELVQIILNLLLSLGIGDRLRYKKVS